MLYKYLTKRENKMKISQEEAKLDENISPRIKMRCKYISKNPDIIKIFHKEAK